MYVLEDRSKCTGCHACYSVCPQKCITMQADAEGFLQPWIDEQLCVNCGLCKGICPVTEPQKGKKGIAYACISKDAEVREQSSSGGVFTLLAEAVLSKGGVVFGAAYDKQLHVRHIGIETKTDLKYLRGSKYVQSQIGDSYVQAKKALDNGRYVLFTGTPCQIYGLKSFLNKEYERLFTQDIICHGVPSAKVWDAYVRYREKTAGAKAAHASFRDKCSGWQNFSMSFSFENGGTYSKNIHQDPYMRGFLGNLFLRNSCYACSFKTLERVSDVTLADFWGADKFLTEVDDKGVSLILANSEGGQKLLEEIQCSADVYSVDIDAAVQYNSAASQSVAKPVNRERFFLLLEQMDFEAAINKCIPKRKLRKYIGKVKRLIKRMCRKLCLKTKHY